MDPKAYPTDLTDGQWAILEPLLTPHRPRGPRRKTSLREVANALLYLLRTGCPWRALPHDLPSWMTVWWYFRKWRDDGTLDRLHAELRYLSRQKAGKKKEPTAGIVDSQSAKTTEKGGHAATTVARRFKDANAILSSIPWDISWESSFILATFRIETERGP